MKSKNFGRKFIPEPAVSQFLHMLFLDHMGITPKKKTKQNEWEKQTVPFIIPHCLKLIREKVLRCQKENWQRTQ